MQNTIVDGILAVLTAFAEWFVSTVNNIVEIFYNTESGITVLGTLACLGLGISAVYGLVRLIRGFMHGRG